MSRAKDNASISSRLRSDVGALVTSDSDSLETLEVGADGYVLTADSSSALGIKWAAAGASGLSAGQITDLTDAGDSTLHYHATDRALGNATGTLAIVNGGTGNTTAQAALNAITAVSGATAGDVLTKVGSDATWATPSGAGIGDVSGPASATSGNLASYNGVTGKLLADSGVVASAVATKTGTETLTNKTMSTSSVWNGTKVGPTYGGTDQTSWTKGDVLYASATNTLSKLPIGTVGQSLQVSASGVPSWGTAAVGLSPSGGDDSTAIQSAINSVASGGGGVVTLERGTYVINATLTIPSYVTLKGQGIDVTILRLKNGANQSVITTTDTSSLISGNTAGGAKYWGVTDLTIDGNKTNNTSGHGIYSYSRTFKIDRVKVEEVKDRGIYTKWCSSCAAWDDDASDMFMEAMINDVYVQSCGQEGIYFNGPHDARISHVLVALCSQTAIGNYDGIYVGPNAGGTVFTTCHSWGDYQRYDWNISCGWVYCANCIADDAYTAGVYVNADKFTWVGGHVFGAVWSTPPSAQDLAMKGFILTSSAWHPYIQTMVTDVPGGSVDFTSAPNGSGTIIVSGSVSATLNTYGTTYGYVGTPPSNWNVQIRVYDPDVNDYYYSVGPIGVATVDDTSNWFATGIDGYWSTDGTHLKVGAASNNVNPPVWVQNTTTYSNSTTSHFASAALFETVKTSGASCPNSLTGSIKVSGGTGDAIGVHGQVVCDVTNGGAMTGVWARATGPTSTPTTGMICGLEVNVDNRHGATSYKARKDNGSLVGALIYNFSGAGKENHFGLVIEGTSSDSYQVGALFEDWMYAGLKLTGTRSCSFGLLIDSESNNQIDKGIAFGATCATAGIALGANKFNWGASTQSLTNEGDMLYNATANILYFLQGSTTTEILAGGGIGTSGSYTADRKLAVNFNGTTYYLLASTTA
jgi:hypothetical protein